MQEPNPDEAHRRITESIARLRDAIEYMEPWSTANGHQGLTYHQTVSALNTANTARVYLGLGDRET